jgi:hypothetical protein
MIPYSRFGKGGQKREIITPIALYRALKPFFALLEASTQKALLQTKKTAST